jgi:3-phenylpropionate/trans-cinnamate dioxygenase ferredoxin reductase subunit
VLEAEAKSAGPRLVALSDGRQFSFDAVILTSGSRFAPAAFPGARKRGVFFLDGAERYQELGRAFPAGREGVVAGEGYRGLEVAERLADRGVKLRVFVSHWEGGAPHPFALDVIEDAAAERGIEIGGGIVSKAVGDGRVEAVLVGGSVVPCDLLAIVPPRLPAPVLSQLTLGQEGGVLVDRTMRASDTLFAAGGCAELKGAAPQSSVLSQEPALSGRVAGSNCTGSAHPIGGTRTEELRLFGLCWSRTGQRTAGLRASGEGLETVGRRLGPDSACAITHEAPGERVVRVESVQPSTVAAAGLLPLETGVTLESLAFGLGSSDISPISETASLVLREWRKS